MYPSFKILGGFTLLPSVFSALPRKKSSVEGVEFALWQDGLKPSSLMWRGGRLEE